MINRKKVQMGWISVEDRLPQRNRPVFIFPPVEFNFTQYVGLVDFNSGEFCAETQNYDGSEWIEADVTHWMPLPQPPQGKK
jgi:hypothetical protein